MFRICVIDGSVYTGEWKEGKYHGLGGMFFGLQCRIFYIQITASYSLILLVSCHGMRTSSCMSLECRWADGRVYKGEWNMGKAHGYGSTLLYTILLGLLLLKSLTSCFSLLVETRANGTLRHDGEWFQDEPVRKNKKKKSRV